MVQCLRGLNELKLSINIEDSTYLIHSVWRTALGRLAKIHSFISAVNFPGRAPALWIRIRQKNTYRVQFDNEALPDRECDKINCGKVQFKALENDLNPSGYRIAISVYDILDNLSLYFSIINEVQPMPHDWTWLDALSGPIDEDFVRAAEDQPATQFRTGSYMLAAWEDPSAATTVLRGGTIVKP